ncbi:MAG TPA: lytic murein transglycosylase [Candidatus Paceibacterota bacterium]|nr:lytic murein transglycosylase [Candidatus Paceibacterota bacterium]
MRSVLRYIFLGAGTLLVTLGVALGALHTVTVHAQTISCNTPEEKAACQKQYDELQAEIAQQQQIINQTEAQKNTYKGNVTNLTAQIKQAQAQIDAKNLQIKQLGSQISQKTVVITQLQSRINAGHDSLASMLRQQQQIDDYSPVEVALSSDDLSSFFADVDAFTSIEDNMQALFSDIKSNKAATEDQKAQLAQAQASTADAKYDIQTKQNKISQDKTAQQQLLNVATANEAAQQKVLAAQQAKAAAIRAALFPLRDAAAIQFGTALQYAQQSQKSTGVDPALVLAILTQESNLGANVGQCYLSNDATGAGNGKNTGTPFANVMSPTRDVPPFLALASALGFDPHHQVVSCPIAGAGGWGGAMGPAQFIASTWSLYASRIASIDGVAVANPWDPRDAITAMSLFLEDLGAGAGGYTAEHTAAAKYYAGAGWATAGQAYANQVMAKVQGIQQNIDFLANNS